MSEKKSRFHRIAVVVLVLGGALGGACAAAGDEEITCSREAVMLEEGLGVTDLRCGSGAVAERGMTATVRYDAALTDGDEISTGPDADDRYTFRIGAGQVVSAWDIGLVGMRVGGIRRLDSPPDLAYAEAGLYPEVASNTPVTFEVELLELTEPPE